MIFLWELIEDYKAAETQDERDEIFEVFFNMAWTCNPYSKEEKEISYIVTNDLMNTDIGKVFYKYERIHIPTVVRETESQRWEYLVKQKINNLYAYQFDRGVCLSKKYNDLVGMPKKLYYKYRNEPETFNLTAEELSSVIEQELRNAEEIRVKDAEKKISLPYGEWKNLCVKWMRKCFDNCMLIDEYCSNTEYQETDSEDNFYIAYICKSLDGYCKNYRIEQYGVKRQRKEWTLAYCENCGKPFQYKQKTKRKQYCDKCQRVKDLEKKRKYYHTTQKEKHKEENRLKSTKKWDSIIMKEND